MEKIDREKLTEIIEAEGGSKWWQPEEFIKHIRSQLPIQLEIIAFPPTSSGNYNCFVFVFNLEKDRDFLGGHNPIQKEFIEYLLNKGILKIKDKPAPGDLVFYKDEAGAITHAGIVESDKKIISKWMWGSIIKHNLWDVPSSFGDEIFFCKPVESAIIKKVYQEYKNSGVKIRPIL